MGWVGAGQVPRGCYHLRPPVSYHRVVHAVHRRYFLRREVLDMTFRYLKSVEAMHWHLKVWKLHAPPPSLLLLESESIYHWKHCRWKI